MIGPRNYPVSEGERIHRIRAEAALGKPLPAQAVVHHADGSKRADAQLVICQDNAYHLLLHARMRVVKAGGNPNTDRVCSRCNQAKPIEQFAPTPARNTGRNHLCHQCDAIKQSNRRAANRDAINARRRARYRMKVN